MRPASWVDVDVDARDDESLPRPAATTAAALHQAVTERVLRGVRVVVATVISTRGSAPSTPGQKLVLTADGHCAGTVGGGALERAVLRAMRSALDGDDEAPSVRSFNLGPSLGMCCGGGVDVLLEPLAVAPPVGIAGAGHVASALAPMLARVGFAVTVTDERDAWADPSRLPDVRVIAATWTALAPHVARSGAVIVMTHQHQLDQEAIEWALREGYAFVGGIGSRAKAIRTRERLSAKGFSAADIARVRMPIGVSIGARSPEEIAVSITAELIAWRRGAALQPGALMLAP